MDNESDPIQPPPPVAQALAAFRSRTPSPPPIDVEWLKDADSVRARVASNTEEAAYEWARLPKPGQTLAGLKRGYLFNLYKTGKIRGVKIVLPGNRQGILLINLPSLLSMIDALDAAQNGPQKGAE